MPPPSPSQSGISRLRLSSPTARRARAARARAGLGVVCCGGECARDARQVRQQLLVPHPLHTRKRARKSTHTLTVTSSSSCGMP